MNKTRLFVLSAIVLCLTVRNLLGAQIQGVTIAAYSKQYNTALGSGTPTVEWSTNLVSRVGLFGDQCSPVPGGSMWLCTNGPAGTNFITFDLGAVHTVDAMKVWNYNENNRGGTLARTNEGVKLANISYSADGVTFTTNLVNQTFNLAPGNLSAFGQTMAMGGVSARYVRINILTNWATAAGLGVGLSKVRFIDNTVPPTILSATENFGSNQVTVLFSESVDVTSAINTANYSLNNGASILSAEMGEYNDRVILHTTLLAGQNYNLTASGVYDSQQVIAIANNSSVGVTPELILWLKADAGVTTDGSGNVTLWNDQSAFGHNAIPVTGSNAPTVISGAVNGLPAVHFDGVNSGQCLQVLDDANLEINGDATIILVPSLDALGNYDIISKTGTKAAGNNNMPAPFDVTTATSSRFQFIWGNQGDGPSGYYGQDLFTPVGALSSSTYFITSGSVQGTNGKVFVNGATLSAVQNWSMAGTDAQQPIRIGVRGDNGSRYLGSLAEIMVIRGTITSADLTTIHNYLGAKYGIAVAQLAITEQPQNATAQAGQTATFWVGVTGAPLYSYQWRSNGVAISGATSATYTTPALTPFYNGVQYDVIVNSVTNSFAATLTVVPDTTAPTIFSAAKAAGSLTNIVVKYSEDAAAGGTNAINYILNGASVLSATYGANSNQVILTTSALDTNAVYYLQVQNIQDRSGNTMTASKVPVLPAKLAIYLRSDSGLVTDSSGTRVYKWRDQTTNGNDATQFAYGTAARPTTGDTINGVPVLNFSGGNSNFVEAASSASLVNSGDMTIYAVANFADFASPREIMGKTYLNYPGSFDYYVANSTTLRFYRGNGTSSSAGFIAANQAPSAGTPHVLTVAMGGTNINHYLDGQSNGGGVMVASVGDAGKPLKIGSRDDLTQFMNGDLAEVMMFSSALSDADRTAVDNYLGTKYFTFAITQPPQNVTTTEGQTATFSVTASQGSTHFNYQWQENGTNIFNATNSSYVTPTLAPGDNNDTFDVVITVPGFSTNTSSTATLTVNNVPPTVISAGCPIWNTAQNTIVVLFSEAVTAVSATDLGSYSLDHGATVLAAAMGDAANKVVLTTTTLAPGISYTLTVQNINDLYGNIMPSGPFPVGLYPAATALWLKSDTGVTVDGSGFVSEWDDQSGNGNNLLNSAGQSFQPQLIGNALNNHPIIYFNATNENYLLANSSSSLAITNDMAIFAVVNFLDYSTNYGSTSVGGGEIVSKTSANQPAPFDYYVTPNGTALRFYRGNGTVNGSANASVVPSSGTPHLVGVQMQGTTATHRLDGNANGTGHISTTIGDNGDPLFIGSRGDGTERLNGDLAELVIVGSALSASDLAAMENYLLSKYSLGVSTQSTNIAVQVSGNQLTLSWPRDHIGWQLQSNSVALTATNAWFTIPGSSTTNQVILTTDSTMTNVFFRMVYTPQ